jgi:N6-L-threonylcarbamoyladenine synthase
MLKKDTVRILAIETSCDETAAAVLEVKNGNKLPDITTLSSVVKSQMKLHSKMGGVVPEAAARAHVKYIRPVVDQSLVTSHSSLADIDYLAVTAGPGLLPSLMVGVEFAKSLSYALNVPIIPVNHMMGHLYSPFGSLHVTPYTLHKNIFPMVSLIVSGGHTMLVLMKNSKEYKVLGQTVDDAAGEAFDKVAKMLKLPYPGGPEVSKLAMEGNPNAIEFPRPMINTKDYNFSFSGLKTSVLYKLQSDKLQVTSYRFKADVCASFQQAVVDVLVAKTMRAVKEFNAKSVSLSGGVAANRALRDTLNATCQMSNVLFLVPPINLCTDNAEMIGLAAGFMLQRGFKPVSYKKITADPNLHL